MQSQSRPELYRQFLSFVSNDVQGERRAINRRMFHTFLWCLAVPAGASIVILLLIRLGILPRWVRVYPEWLVLIFPILYTFYILSIEVLAEMPAYFRRGGVACILDQAAKEGGWREGICEQMEKAVSAKKEDWDWILSNFKMDLSRMRYRNSHMTALAGAVLYLIMQGIDSLGDEPRLHVTSSNWTQMIGLVLFLVLFYLSGSQVVQLLGRYLSCVEILRLRQEQQDGRSR